MKVPLLITSPPPEFGELTSSPEFSDPSGMARDYTFVPGFSNLRRERDEALVEVLQGKRRMNEVPTLPRNFRWARCQNKKGDPDSRKVINAGMRGYTVVTKDDVGEGKLLPKLPGGASIAADGSIRQGDCQLMVTDAQQAARNEFQKRLRTENAMRQAESGIDVGGQPSLGAAPFIQKEVGRRVRAELAPKSDAQASK